MKKYLLGRGVKQISLHIYKSRSEIVFSMYAQASAQIFCFVVWQTPAFTISASPAPIVCLSSPLLHILPSPRFSSKILLQDSVSKALPPPPPFPILFQTSFPDPIHAAVISMLTGLSLSLTLCLTSSTLLSPSRPLFLFLLLFPLLLLL